MEPKNEDMQQEVDTAQAEVETLEEASPEEKDTTDWKAKFEEADGIRRRLQTKLEKSKIEKKAEEIVEKQSKTGDLDETQLDYLDLKGISDTDDLDVIQKVMLKTGLTVRQALKDEWVQDKLAKNKAARDVKDATPSTSKRSSTSPINDIAIALAKYEQTGQLPDDFKLRSAVINAKVDRENTNKPTWH